MRIETIVPLMSAAFLLAGCAGPVSERDQGEVNINVERSDDGYAARGADPLELDVDRSSGRSLPLDRNGDERPQAPLTERELRRDGQRDANPPREARAQSLYSERQPPGERAGQTLRLVIDKSDRKLRVYRGETVERTHDVAVGQADHETPSGQWRIQRVDINPDWQPPDSEWAEGEEPRPPGHPQNPMGRVRMVYNAPYSIHGTTERGSLGRAASHGSIRLANDVALEVAEMVLRASGDWHGDAWFERIKENREEMRSIRLKQPVTVEIRE
jgi:lipoprotein-anchoring transpeptidase ErfK/SrfK